MCNRDPRESGSLEIVGGGNKKRPAPDLFQFWRDRWIPTLAGGGTGADSDSSGIYFLGAVDGDSRPSVWH